MNSFPSSSDPEPSPAQASYSRRRIVAGGALGLFGAAVLSACGQDGGSGQDSSASASASGKQSEPADAQVKVEPAADAQEVNPATPITVTVSDGKLTKVEVTGGEEPVEGTLAKDGSSWTSKGPLAFETTYTVEYTVAEGKDGKKTGTGQSSFTTVPTQNQADAKFNVVQNETYGTGQIIQIDFSEPVTERKKVEQAIKVTGGGNQPGRFRWYSDTMVRYRPKDKWAPNSTVTIDFPMFGMDIGKGQIGMEDYHLSFKTGPTHFAYVDNNTKLMKVYENGKLTQTFPVTLGDKEWPSVTGQLVIIEQKKKYHFDASTLGLKEGDDHWYEAFDATNTSRITDSGAFVHQAEPSAYDYVGRVNISHGCIGLLPDAAEYFYDTFRVGDVVETVNTGYPQADPDNGYGDWNIPWNKYTDSSWKGNW